MRSIPEVQKQRARTMRNEPTRAEHELWRRLRNRQLDGVKFSRQIAIGPFIADFAARDRKLIVEVDGRHHGEDVDAGRTRWLERQGYTVVRFDNDDVLGAIERVLAAIGAACRDCPPLAPPVPGGGPASVDDPLPLELPY